MIEDLPLPSKERYEQQKYIKTKIPIIKPLIHIILRYFEIQITEKDIEIEQTLLTELCLEEKNEKRKNGTIKLFYRKIIERRFTDHKHKLIFYVGEWICTGMRLGMKCAIECTNCDFYAGFY
jgi:hypothetical protein